MEIKPIYKWTGGKRKEIKIFSEYYPDFVKEKKDYLYIEPFFGGGAVYWDIKCDRNIINDIDMEMINFLNTLKTNSGDILEMIKEMGENISEVSIREKQKIISIAEAKKERGIFYYKWRDKDRNENLKNLSNVERAFRFLFVNQMAFNGMRRFNSRGEFNVPYGNYKSFNPVISNEHLDKLRNTEILCGDYSEIILNNDEDDVFIYIDPPYTRAFKEYSHDNIFGEEKQIELFNVFSGLKKAKAMIIINKDEFTTELYKDYIKADYDLKYSTNIKNRFDNSVKHLIITNY